MSTLKAAFKAYVFNKISDVALLLAFLIGLTLNLDLSILVFNVTGQTINTVNVAINKFGVEYIEIMSALLILAAFIKSAQFGVHLWLPDSMEAPVPASALIHSATLVSAGVYLLLRFSFIFEISKYALSVVAISGSLTAFYGGWCAMFQSDVKRILAYSTISHCGFLMVLVTLKTPELVIFYLYVHGFFKAAAFLCIGNVIRASHNYQDFRRMGGL